MAPRRVPAIPLLVVAIASVQGGASLAKELFPGLGPSGASGVRLVFASLALLVAFRPRLWRYGAREWKAIVPYGIALGGMNLSFYEALARIPLGLAVTLEFVGPLGVALFGSRRPADFAWVLLAGTGIALIAPWEGTATALDPWGVALALFAGGCWAGYILAGGRVSRVLTEGESVTAGMIVATLVVLPFALADGVLARSTPSLLGLGAVVALLSSALPYTLEMFALKALPSRTFGILMSLEPAVAALAGLVFLHERLDPPQWLAVVCVCAASAGAALTSRAQSTPAETAPAPP